MFGRRKSKERSGTPADLLVVGLGNPGEKYDGTRHNVGAEVIEVLAERYGEKLKASRQAALTAEVRRGDYLMAIAFPQTFMNHSGVSVRDLASRYGITDPTEILVIHDELDLEPGTSKVKLGGGLAGHNGLKSINRHIHSQDFARIRIGIGRPPGRQSVSDHVLRRPGKDHRVEIDIEIQRAADVVERFLTTDIEAIMNDYNRG